MKKPLASLLLVVIILVSSVFVGGAFAASTEKIPVIVGFKDLPDAALIHAHGGDITYQYSIINAIACSLPSQAVDALQKNHNVAYVENDIQVSAADIELDNSWGVKHIGAGTVQASGNEGQGIKAAVLDTGINYLHEELTAATGGAYKGGVDIINNDADPFDDNGHGTHCAGIIAAADNDNNVVVGVAPKVSLYSVKVLNSQGSGSTSTIIAGIQWAVNNHMQIISMSLGASTGTTSLQQACDNAYAAGILVVAASGNDYRSTISYPAKYDSVIAVGATDSSDNRASFSNYGDGIELMAPGVNILSTYIDVSPKDGRNIDVLYMSGTSMATPHVAGVAALVFASTIDPNFDANHNGVWDASEVRAKLQSSADDLGASGKDNTYGYGLVDAVKATTSSVDNAPPTISGITPNDGALINTAAPTISATVSDASGIGSINMQLDGFAVTPINYVGTIVSYQATSLSQGLHQVSLTATDTLGNPPATKTWTFTVDSIAPAKVTGLTITSVSTNGVVLNWDSVNDAATYNVIRNGAKVAPTTTASFSDTGLTPSTTYSYTVTAVDSAGNQGTASEPISAKTSDAPLMHVGSIVMALKTSGFNTYATATVKIVDANNNPASSATVMGKWSSGTTNNIGQTQTDGTVFTQSNNVRNAPRGTTFTFIVTGVTLTGYTFAPSSSDTNSIKK